MERLIKRKVWMVLLFAAVLVLPFAVKIVHVYQNNIHEEHDNCSGHSHHDCDNCLVCQFTVSTFTETTFIGYNFLILPTRFEPVVFYRNKVYQRIVIPYGLRAPPMI